MALKKQYLQPKKHKESVERNDDPVHVLPLFLNNEGVHI